MRERAREGLYFRVPTVTAHSEITRGPITRYLWFNIQDGDHALRVDLPDRLQPGSVHGVLVAAVLQIVVVADVLHHLVVRHEVVVLAVLLVLLRRPSCVCGGGGGGAKNT